jgi:hypothetical protein
VLVGGLLAGLVLGPKLAGSPPAAHASASDDHAESKEDDHSPPEKVVSVTFDPIVIDVREKRGDLHHLKVGLAAELKEGVAEADFKLVIPRGREVALTYLRTLSFQDVTDPEMYGTIKEELAKRVTEAVGKNRVHRILLIDFVAQ